MNLPRPWSMIVFTICIFALGLGGVLLAFGNEIIEWLRFGREMVSNNQNTPTETGATLSFLSHVVTSRWF